MGKVIHRLGDDVVEVGEWVEDRVLCESCGHMDLVQDSISMPAGEMEKLRKVNHPANRWMFETAVVNNDWARVRFKRRHCDVDGLLTMPAGLMHRCPSFRDKLDKSVNIEEATSWWE
tara:strand:- start:8273 stop:8623 length:351 start_codon:yes stop_codon:yes gene_type:complete